MLFPSARGGVLLMLLCDFVNSAAGSPKLIVSLLKQAVKRTVAGVGKGEAPGFFRTAIQNLPSLLPAMPRLPLKFL